jgi:uncharacterized membrane protein
MLASDILYAMTHSRLHGLTDAFFAIVMTLLVLELKTPESDIKTNHQVWHILTQNMPTILSYLISFALLFIYWRAHTFIISVVAKNLDVNLVNLNIVFLLLVGVVPYTTHLLGLYPQTQAAIIVYAVNIILIGLLLWAMRAYIDYSEKIKSENRTTDQRINANIRLFTPIICAAIAILLCFLNTWLAFGVILLGIAFNLLNNTAELTRKILKIKPTS